MISSLFEFQLSNSPPVLYVDFNDTYDNTIAVVLGDGMHPTHFMNYHCLNSKIFKPIYNWEKTSEAKTVDELVDVFHECYERMVQDSEDFEAECLQACLDAGMEEDPIARIEPRKPIGKLIEH